MRSTPRWQRPATFPNKKRMCIDVDRYPSPFFINWYLRGSLLGTSRPPAQTREDPDGNHTSRSSHRVFARRWGLGIFPLAQGLALFLVSGGVLARRCARCRFIFERRMTNGNSLYRRPGRLALAGLAGSNQADGGMCTKPPCPRPARSNSAGRGSASESFVHTSEGLAIGREPTACRAQMAKARRRGSRVLRSVRCVTITD
jgi:hypothetical protein